MDRFQKLFRLIKVDEAQRIVYGLVTAEREDKDGETCHYDSTKPQYKAVNDEMGKATDGQNIMPLREMHQLHAVGAGKSIEFDDTKKEIHMAFKVVEDSTWKKVMEKVLTGFSQGGRYLKKWKENGKNYYTAEPGEVSLVDNPCLSGAVIEYAKADGTVEQFTVPESPLARLTDADIQRLSKALADSILSTGAQTLEAKLAELVRQHSADDGNAFNAAKGEDMNKEQIEKCAAALGITTEEFKKRYIDGDGFEKAAKGLAALHGHIQKAHAHHEEMHSMHTKLGKMHEAHAAHLGKCMKACKDVMGSDEEAGKAFKALLGDLGKADELVLIGKTVDGVEIFRKAGTAEVKLDGLEKKADAPAGITEDQMKKAIADALAEQKKEFDAQLEKTLAPNNGGTGARMQLVGRDGKIIEKSAAAAALPTL